MNHDHFDKEHILTARADLVRSRLHATLTALDKRRHDALDVPLQISKHLGIVAGIAALTVAGAVVVGFVRAASAARRRRRARWQLLRRAWEHPERVAQPEETLTGKIAKAAALALARYVVGKLVAGRATENEQEAKALSSGDRITSV